MSQKPKRKFRPLYLITSLLRESDRGAVVTGAAYLDSDLKRLLGCAFKASMGVKQADINAVFKGATAPLQPFAAKIKLARAMGLISKQEATALNKVRDIRNQFAHQELRDSIERGMADSAWFAARKISPEFEEVQWPKHEGVMTEARARFVFAVTMIHAGLGAAIKVQLRFNPIPRKRRKPKREDKPQSGHHRSKNPKPSEGA